MRSFFLFFVVLLVTGIAFAQTYERNVKMDDDYIITDFDKISSSNSIAVLTNLWADSIQYTNEQGYTNVSDALDALFLSGGGYLAIADGVNQVTVTGLGLAYTPSMVIASVQKPAGGYSIFASPDASSYSPDGFTVDLSGLTDSANYTLSYIYYQ